jgi:hypothetical protein
MKICPKCQKTYNDDNLNFCLDDGAVLSQASRTPVEDKLPETVMMSSPRPTSPNQPVNNPTPPTWGHQQQQSQPTWGATPSYQTPQTPAKSSKSWIWVLGILAAIVVVCGGGLVGLGLIVANMEPTETGNTNKTIDFENKKSPIPESGKVDKIDLSKWTDTNPAYATSEYKNGEFIMGTKQKGYYYVLVASTLYQTEDATTKVSIRNVEEKPSRLGYGLIFHSNPKPLIQDYGFIIDSDKQRYRVVSHTPGKETDIIKWTKSTIIKNGTQKNVLEVRDKDGDITFYINDQKIDSIKNKDGYSGGVPGIYTGDAVQVAFSDLQISK